MNTYSSKVQEDRRAEKERVWRTSVRMAAPLFAFSVIFASFAGALGHDTQAVTAAISGMLAAVGILNYCWRSPTAALVLAFAGIIFTWLYLSYILRMVEELYTCHNNDCRDWADFLVFSHVFFGLLAGGFSWGQVLSGWAVFVTEVQAPKRRARRTVLTEVPGKDIND
jgi:hypothetical protein